ncbi:MAG: hypothetical protein HY537_17065 [Deltaproteobacteria bacterium]|nr:hypothetical protein [Deltaproteobacteria bacterium]
MRNILGTLILALGTVISFADPMQCPHTLSYAGGGYLKSGTTFFYRSGNYLKSGNTLYYPSGGYLKSGETYYYPAGAYLKSGSTVYYPSGQHLKSGDVYYYPSGLTFKSGSTFYYPGGQYARNGKILYRPDGSETPFPVYLQAEIGSYGKLSAIVREESENISIQFYSQLIQTPEVNFTADWDGDNFTTLVFQINTGVAEESVLLTYSNNQFSCALAQY